MEVVALSAAAAAASALACFAASASRDAPPTTTVPQVRPFLCFALSRRPLQLVNKPIFLCAWASV